MYTTVVDAGFSAVHRVPLADGTLEPIHGHDWTVRVHVSRPELDGRGMVVDFCQVRSVLESILAGLQHTDLNEHKAFAGRPPTAEWVATYVFDRLVGESMPGITRVEVSEAPGCMAVYEPTVPPPR